MTAVITPPRASLDRSAARYHVNSPSGNHLQLLEHHTVLPNGQAVIYLVLTNGGDRIVLSQQNAADLAPGVTNFGTNGVLS